MFVQVVVIFEVGGEVSLYEGIVEGVVIEGLVLMLLLLLCLFHLWLLLVTVINLHSFIKIIKEN